MVFDNAAKRHSVVQSGAPGAVGAAGTVGTVGTPAPGGRDPDAAAPGATASGPAAAGEPAPRGADGLPSNRQAVVPPSSAETWMFHMIQPVVLNQWKRSPVSTVGPRSLCRLAFSSTSISPPWPWTMGLGRPVVPLE